MRGRMWEDVGWWGGRMQMGEFYSFIYLNWLPKALKLSILPESMFGNVACWLWSLERRKTKEINWFGFLLILLCYRKNAVIYNRYCCRLDTWIPEGDDNGDDDDVGGEEGWIWTYLPTDRYLTYAIAKMTSPALMGVYVAGVSAVRGPPCYCLIFT